MKKILITGGAGFIGSNLALHLKSEGHQVTVLDNLSEQIHGKQPKNSSLYQSIHGKVNFINGDVTNREDLEKALYDQEVIIHLAAETGTGQSMYSLEKYNKVNVFGTALILDILVNKENKIQQFILASSRAVYGEGKYKNVHDEVVYPGSRSSKLMEQGIYDLMDSEGQFLSPLSTDEYSNLNPGSFYGLTKLQQEQMVAFVCPTIGINYSILRYQNVYGVGQSLVNPYTGILSIFSTQILAGNTLNIFEDGKMTRDFINITDVVRYTSQTIDNQKAWNKIINIGTGIATDVLSVANLLGEFYGKNIKFEITGNFRVGDIRYNVADLLIANECLEFVPSVSLKDGIRDFCSWVLKQPTAESNLERSLHEMKAKGFLK